MVAAVVTDIMYLSEQFLYVPLYPSAPFPHLCGGKEEGQPCRDALLRVRAVSAPEIPPPIAWGGLQRERGCNFFYDASTMPQSPQAFLRAPVSRLAPYHRRWPACGC